MLLSALKQGQSAIIADIDNKSQAEQITSLGLFPGERVHYLRSAPTGDPIQVKAGFTLISLRKKDAQHVRLQPQSLKEA